VKRSTRNVLGLALIVFSSLFFFSHWYLSNCIRLVAIAPGQIVTSDFIVHLIMVKAVWLEKVGSIYQPDAQLEALSRFAGSRISTSMPEGVSPILYLLWAPLAPLLEIDPEAAQAVWISLSLLLVVWSLFPLLHDETGRSHLFYFALLVAATFFSACSVRALLLGQTSVFGLGVFLLLYHCARNENNSQKSFLLPALLMFLLAIKPSYLLVGLLILGIYGKFMELFVSLTLVIFALIFMSFRLDWNWPMDYLAQLQVFFAEEVPPIYAAAISLSTLNNFVRAFLPCFGRNSYKISSAIGGLLTAAALLHALLQWGDERTRRQSIVLVFASFLLFSPYLAGYEDISLLFLALLPQRRTLLTKLLTLLFLIFLLNFPLFPFVPALILFAIKAWFVIMSFYCVTAYTNSSPVLAVGRSAALGAR
jgi:hypothetical protein